MNALLSICRILSFPVTCLLLYGCISEQTDACVQYELTVRAVTPSGEDVTSSGVITSMDIYLFDESGFVRMVPKGSSSDFLFGVEKSKTLTLIAWGNLKGDSLKLPSPTVGTSLEEAKVELLELATGYNLPVTDLFYARRVLTGETATRAMQSDTVRLVMERLSAALAVKIGHAREYFGSDEPLHLVVRGTGTALSFLGEPLGQEAGYAPAMTAVSGKDEWVAPLFRVFPTQDDGRIVVDLYRKGEKLFTITTDDEGNLLRATPGKETYISVDFRYARMFVSVSVLPWGSSGQQTDL
jgi:hypothetical protein